MRVQVSDMRQELQVNLGDGAVDLEAKEQKFLDQIAKLLAQTTAEAAQSSASPPGELRSNPSISGDPELERCLSPGASGVCSVSPGPESMPSRLQPEGMLQSVHGFAVSGGKLPCGATLPLTGASPPPV